MVAVLRKHLVAYHFPVVWTPEKVAGLKKDIEAGLTASELAAIHGVTRSALLKVASRKVGISPVDKGRHYSDWPDDRIAALKGRWAEGASASIIAKELGITRNAVIGKVHRLGLEARKKHPAGGRPPSAHKRVYKPVLKLVPPLVADELIPIEQRKHFLDLTPKCCRWPVGDPRSGFWDGDLFFCGADAAEGKPYCSSHAWRAVLHDRR